MRFLLSLPLPLLLILISAVSFDSQSVPFDVFEQRQPAPRRFNRSANDPIAQVAGAVSNTTLPHEYSEMSADQLISAKEAAEANVTELKAKRKTAQEALDKKVAEDVAPKKDYEDKKAAWESMSQLFEDMKEEKRKVQKAIDEFVAAELHFNNTKDEVDTATDEVQTFQTELSKLKDRRDQIKNMPERRITAESEQAEANRIKPGLVTEEGRLREIKDKKFDIVDLKQKDVNRLKEKENLNECKTRPTTECNGYATTIARLTGEIPSDNTTFNNANDEWKNVKEKLDECTTKLKNLKAELKDINAILPMHDSKLNDAQTLVDIKSKEEGPMNQTLANAVKARDLAQEELTKKEKAKIKAVEAAAAAPVDLNAAEMNANNARDAFNIADTAWRTLTTYEDQLTKERNDLEARLMEAHERVGQLEQEYQKKLKNKPATGNTALIAIAVVCAILSIAGILGLVYYCWNKLKKAIGKGKPVKGATSQTPGSKTPSTISQQPPGPSPLGSDSKKGSEEIPYTDKETPVKMDGTLAYIHNDVQISNTEDPQGNNKRVLCNGVEGYCQDGRSFKLREGDKENGVEEDPIDETKPNPNADRTPYFSVCSNVFVLLKELFRLGAKERALDRELTKKSQKARAEERSRLSKLYCALLAKRSKEGKKSREKAGREKEKVETRRDRKQTEQKLREFYKEAALINWVDEIDESYWQWTKRGICYCGSSISNGVYACAVFCGFRRAEIEKARVYLSRKAWMARQELPEDVLVVPEDETKREEPKVCSEELSDPDRTLTEEETQPNSESIMPEPERMLPEEKTQPNSELQLPEQPITPNEEETQATPVRSEAGRGEEGRDKSGSQRSDRGDNSQQSGTHTKEKKAKTGEKNKKAKTGANGKKNKKNATKKIEKSGPSSRDDSDDRSSRVDQKQQIKPEENLPGFEHMGEHIVRLEDEKMPDLKRLTHDSNGELRKVQSDEEKWKMCDRIIDHLANLKQSELNNFNKDDLLNIMNQCMKLFEEGDRLIKFKHCKIKTFGDTHGTLDSVVKGMKEFGKIGSEQWLSNKFVFTGDYVDRGTRSVDLITFLFALRIRYPDNIVLLRGNHESYEVNIHYGFRGEVLRRFGQDGNDMHFFFNYVFAFMPLACLTTEGTLFMHGGIPTFKIDNLEEINKIPKFLWEPTKNKLATALLWNDPQWGLKGCAPNGRGLGFTFGEDMVRQFCKEHNVKLIVRAHQVVRNGYEFFAGRLMVSIFTATNYEPDMYPNHGAIMCINEDYLIYFVELVPFEGEIPTDPTARTSFLSELKKTTAWTHNLYNFISILKGANDMDLKDVTFTQGREEEKPEEVNNGPKRSH